MSAAPRKIFCGGLPKTTAGDELVHKLTEYFEKFGTVVTVDVKSDNAGINRGFGFVEFHDESGVEAVLAQERDSHKIEGRRIEVKPYANNVSYSGMQKEDSVEDADKEEPYVPEPPPIPTSGECKIFVGGLPQGVDEAKLTSYFGSYGTVVAAEVSIDQNTGNNKGFGFVTFENLGGVQNAVKNFASHELDGKWIEVRQFGDKSAKKTAYKAPPPKAGGVGCDKWRTLFIGGLPHSVTNDHLWEHFAQFGEIVLVDVRTDPLTGESKGFGFVEFARPDSVQYAVQAQNLHHIDGKWVDVKRFGQSDGPNKGGGKGGKSGKSQRGMPLGWNQYSGGWVPPPKINSPGYGSSQMSMPSMQPPMQQPMHHPNFSYGSFAGAMQPPPVQYQQLPPMQQQYPLSQSPPAYPMSASGGYGTVSSAMNYSRPGPY